MKITGYNAFFFDFDFTLVNSSRGIIMCYKYAFEQAGLPIPSDLRICQTIGLRVRDSYTDITGDSDPVMRDFINDKFIEKADVVMTPNTVWMPYAREFLQLLRENGIFIGIVSNKRACQIEKFFEIQNSPELLDFVIGALDVKNGKPDPEGLNAAIAASGFNKSECLYIGDSTIDAETAARAGVDFAAVTTGTTTRADFISYPNVGIYENFRQMM